MANQEIDRSKRRFLVATTMTIGGMATAGVATPLVMSMLPSEAAKAAGAPVEVDLSKIEPGMKLDVEWRGKPVWVVHRSEEMYKGLTDLADKVSDPNSELPLQPIYTQNVGRSIKPEYLVLVGICTHLGCVPVARFDAGGDTEMGEDWKGGFHCPCHGSKFDLAGRVFKSQPAPKNLIVPPYKYLSDTRILIGEDQA
jgi:ubiquinol-cytochrome c reductase iron-sulfur subunit